MSWLSLFRRIEREHWFVCSHCMMHTGHDTLKSVFYYDGPGEDFLGRRLVRCPRCSTTETRSFRDLKNEGSESALWGLERIVKQHPRRHFVVKPAKNNSPN
jgi:hypothetical protein